MSWTDRIAVENILKLKREFGLRLAIETGTFRGINAELYSLIFDQVISCEKNEDFYHQAQIRLAKAKNVTLVNMPSALFLKSVHPYDEFFVYLDAHFYDPHLKQKWVVIDELESLKKCTNIVLCIHDFDNGMGHLIYDGESLDWKLLEPYLKGINPDFHYYTNTECDPFTETNIKYLPITVDDAVLDAIKFVHSTPQREQRGMLFCTPRMIDVTKYKLRELC